MEASRANMTLMETYFTHGGNSFNEFHNFTCHENLIYFEMSLLVGQNARSLSLSLSLSLSRKKERKKGRMQNQQKSF